MMLLICMMRHKKGRASRPIHYLHSHVLQQPSAANKGLFTVGEILNLIFILLYWTNEKA